MKIEFQKPGIVKVGLSEDQSLNLQNPKGFVTAMRIDMLSEVLELEIQAYDDRNAVVRQYPLTLDVPAKLGLLAFFTDHVRRIARESYDEFKDLQEIQK